MEKKYLNHEKSIEIIKKIKFLDEKKNITRKIKSKEDYRLFYNSKSPKNIKLRKGLPRFPDKYYTNEENIKFDWFHWLNLKEQNTYHFKGYFRNSKINLKIRLNFKKQNEKIEIDFIKLYEDLAFIFKKFKIASRRDWMEFYKTCVEESFKGSLFSLKNFFDKNSNIKFFWEDMTQNKEKNLELNSNLNSQISFSKSKKYLNWYQFEKKIKSALKFLDKNAKYFDVKKNDLKFTSIKEWKLFYKKYKSIIYFHDSLSLKELKTLSSYRLQTNLIPYLPHIEYKKNFISYSNLSEQSFYHMNKDIITVYTSFKIAPDLLDIYDRDGIDGLDKYYDNLINNSKKINPHIKSLAAFGMLESYETLEFLAKHSSKSLRKFRWSCPDCPNTFEKSLQYMSDKKIPFMEKHDKCLSPSRISLKKPSKKKRSDICEFCYGSKEVEDEYDSKKKVPCEFCN